MDGSSQGVVALTVTRPGARARRERRERVGRGFEMAKEIAAHLRAGSRVLDVGCGSGYIAHHLSALLGQPAHGIDVEPSAEAPIAYRRFDGKAVPYEDGAVDAVLFCYVLHHAADAVPLLAEARRVLARGGRIVIYEDTPRTWFDRFWCWRHDRKWRPRTGPCTFRRDDQWRNLFEQLGLRVVFGRALSRWRDPGYPVARSFYVLEVLPA
jgi:ubiquinone/menaquinone biosynthesis C-methylase UbiE